MDDIMHNGEFWLPSEFLGDHDILMDKENMNKIRLKNAAANYGFNTGFPCDFASSPVFSSLDPLRGSTETESEEEDLLCLTELTRRLARSSLEEKPLKTTHPSPNFEKSRILSSSPQSTLCVVGSWSGLSSVSSNGSPNCLSQVPSPPTTPSGGNNDAWDLIYAAAEQVARLKMYGEGPPSGRGVLGPWSHTPAHHPAPPAKNPNAGFYDTRCLPRNLPQFEKTRHDQVLEQRYSAMLGRPATVGFFSQQNQLQPRQIAENRGRILRGSGFVSNGGLAWPLGLSHSAWPPLQVQQQNPQNLPARRADSGVRAAFLGGSGVKRECAGTGVFIPRRYGNPTESRKKPGCSIALPPIRVVQASIKNNDDTAAQAGINAALVADYEALVARRNALLLSQQKQNLRPARAMNYELCLPPEWTY